MPARMNTESRRRASAAYHAKREAAGLKKVTLWLSPAARDALEALKARHGSKDAAAEAAIMGHSAANKAIKKALANPPKVEESPVKSRLKGEWKAP